MRLLNRNQMQKSEKCGCFYCLAIFPINLIGNWIDKDDLKEGQTAVCPYCKVDSVIGDASGYQINVRFLHDMYKKWFRNVIVKD